MTVIFNDMGETVHSPRKAREIERQVRGVLYTAEKVRGSGEIMTLLAAMLRQIDEADVAAAIDAVVADEITPRVSALEEQAADIERYGNV